MTDFYLNKIMQNDFLYKESTDILNESEDFDDKKTFKGGNINNLPTGGFPPIFKCVKEEIKKEDEKKDRGCATKMKFVSMNEILKNRREETPFTL